MRKYIIIVLTVISAAVHGQSSDFAALLESGSDDAELLIEGYLKPLYTAAGFGLSGGWSNTAATHDVLGVDLTLSVGFLNVPDKDLFYRTDNLGMVNTTQVNGNQAPTVFGPSGEELRPEYEFTDPETGETATFTGPEGIDLADGMNDLLGINKSMAPVPMANLGIGLPAGTDLRIRWLPAIRVGDDTNFNFWGIGVQHSLKPYFGLQDKTFELSAFAGITSFRVKTDLRNDVITTENDVISTNGEGITRLQSMLFRGMISKELSVFTFYGGVGYTFVTTTTEVNGTFIYDSGQEQTVVDDPIDFKYNFGGPSVTAGVRVKLLVFSLHSSYTIQRYNSFELGFGITVH
ncbi:DUF6588 family protein [Fulvivirga sedimenti]|uniref:Uncharacterized protein n=1 Tax=Fulvivirga sedimenti TaxID=2879465 RepID=A0A9X1HVA7_9BACT|nr:DUF6588 family protein [Fulvivirga sedimenti]MCA6078010.1 hypothetical protein [Fulvivirga sedimenti]